ncbi:MAG: cobalamin B12-binding domain-containing protein [Nitrospirae bacterium]|nr:cobalamin B12-binding domain-containing protein [Nitrospirota bacterium]
MNSKKILFITPPYHCGVVEVAGRWVPLTFVYLAGAVRKAGFEPVIYDAMTKHHGFAEIEERIRKENPRFVATTAITSTAPDALEVLRIAKDINPEIITIIGGVHPNFMYGEILLSGSCDYVVRGEGEETLPDLLISLQEGSNPLRVAGIAYKEGHKILATSKRPFIEDLDSLLTAWDLIEWKDYRYFVIPGSRLGAVSTSRGCNHNCTFCSQQKFWNQSWRGRKPESVVAEIEELYTSYGVNVILLPDEYPTKDRQRWERLLDLLIEKGLGVHLLMETRAEDILRDRDILHKYRAAGIIHVYIGVEATNQATLDLIKKDVSVETGVAALNLLHAHGIITETSFILGFPHETKESIERTLSLAKHYNPDFAHFLALAPWPYADMHKEMKPFIVDKDYRKYNLIDPVIKPAAMTLHEIDRAIISCYQQFYMSKMTEIMSMDDKFKKDYLIRSMKLMMSSSFIKDKIGSLGVIPPQVMTLLKTVEQSSVSVEGQSDFVLMAARSIAIDAPVDAVFSLVADPANWPKFISGLTEIRGIDSDTITNGSSFGWTYRIGGFTVRGNGTVVDYENGRALTLRMHNMMPLEKTIRFEEFGAGTKLFAEVGHRSPGKALSVVFNLIRRTVNTMEANAVLAKVKELCEGRKETEMPVTSRCPVKRFL